MKKSNKTIELIFSIILLCVTIIVSAQTVTLYTPNGSTVEAFINAEMTSQNITYYTNLYRNTYPQAEVLANASSTYNCHSYAWNLSEGGTTICWLNQSPDLHKYWDDYSYSETTESNAEKIFYYNGDHSAVKSKTVPGMCESKWGAMPLMRHAPIYGPSLYCMSYRRYYNKIYSMITLSGSTKIYSQGTYTITNLPVGATVQWSTLIPDYATITGQGTSTATFNFYRGLDGHDDEIKASVLVNGVVIKELTLSVFVGLGVSSIESLEYCGYNVLIAHATEDDNPNPNLTCTWTCNDGQFVYFPYGDDASFADKGSRVTAIQVAQSGYYTVCATLNDGTYTSPQFCSSVYINANGSYSAFSLYPNPATSSVTLSLLDTDMVAKNTSQQENALNSSSNIQTVNGLLNKYEIQLWNSTGLVKRIITDQPQYQMSLNGVSKGFYYVVVIRNGKTYRQQLVVNKN